MSNIKNIVGDRIRSLRGERGWSQEELAHRSDIHPSHLGQIERGEKSVTIDSLEKIVNALGITFEELFMFVKHQDKNKDTAALFGIINKLINRSVDDQITISKIIDTLFCWKDK